MLRTAEFRKAAEASAGAGQAVLGETGQPLQKTFAKFCSGHPASNALSCAVKVAVEQGVAFGRTRKVPANELGRPRRSYGEQLQRIGPFNLEQTLKCIR